MPKKGKKLDKAKFAKIVLKFRMQNWNWVKPMTMQNFLKQSWIKYNSRFTRIIETWSITQPTIDMLEKFFIENTGKKDFKLPMK